MAQFRCASREIVPVRMSSKTEVKKNGILSLVALCHGN